jgi:hypothetical protein
LIYDRTCVQQRTKSDLSFFSSAKTGISIDHDGE